MLLIDSLYINNSGGKVLLDYLVYELEKRNINPYYLFDMRCYGDFLEIPAERKAFLEASLLERHKFYKQNKNKFSSVFCFGNIPPTIRLKVPIYTYFHNVLRIKPYKYKNLFKRLIVNTKKQFIKYLSSNTTFFIVQTEYLKEILCKEFNFNNEKCLVYPFFKFEKSNMSLFCYNNKKEGFVYISNGYPHKNHSRLFSAWEVLACKNIYPELHVTITDDYTKLTERIRHLKKKGIKIFNYGFINPLTLYSSYKYVIYPSLNESFGLGLIEGAMYNCNIIASDKSFVYNVVKPSLVFDPTNHEEIANSVLFVLNNEINKTELVVKNRIDEMVALIYNSGMGEIPHL